MEMGVETENYRTFYMGFWWVFDCFLLCFNGIEEGGSLMSIECNQR